MKLLEKARAAVTNERGLIGYGIAWLMGVPLTVLVVIYLIFGR